MRALRRFLDLVWAWRGVWRDVRWETDDALVWQRFAASPTGARFAQHLRNAAIRASFSACSDPHGGEWSRGYAAGVLHAISVIETLSTATTEPESVELRETAGTAVTARLATAG